MTPRITRVLTLLLLACLVWICVRLIALWFAGPSLPVPVIPELTRSEPAVAIVDSDWQLFGPAETIDYGVAESVQPTPLNLVLRGVVAGEGGYAIVMDENGDEGVYRVNDEITGGARVERIELRRVLMIRNGQREALELPGRSSGRRTAIAGTAAPAANRANSELAAGIGIASLSGITDALFIDPAAFANQITIMPVAGGGFRVRAGRDATVFTRLGFHLNDIVLAINGQPVNNQADVQAIFTDFQSGQAIAITIQRGDRRLVLTPDIHRILGGS